MIGMVSALALPVGVLSAAFVLLVLNWYARFTEDEIAIKRLIGFREEVYPYSSVEQVLSVYPRAPALARPELAQVRKG
jgi:hypothetical protein